MVAHSAEPDHCDPRTASDTMWTPSTVAVLQVAEVHQAEASGVGAALGKPAADRAELPAYALAVGRSCEPMQQNRPVSELLRTLLEEVGKVPSTPSAVNTPAAIRLGAQETK